MSIFQELTGLFRPLVREHLLAMAAMAVLLVVSATFSGCETSLFSLTAPELNRARRSRLRFDRIIAALHGNLKSLLPTILFCNMAVNILTFALTAGVAASLGRAYGGGTAFLFSGASLLVVVFFGEVFPKQLAIASSLLVARLTALPVWLVYRVLDRPMRVLSAVVTGIERAVAFETADAGVVREEELRLLVKLSRADGVISDGEYELIDGIVGLPEVRVRDIMVPRMDVTPLPPGASPAEIIALARQARHCKLPVLDERQDDLAGWVDAREVYAELGGRENAREGSAESFLKEFRFFSEHDRADQVLERIKNGGGDLFAVVDERGRIIGFFTLQDIMDEVLGHFGENGAPPPTEVRERDGRYVVSGRLSVKEWRELFGVAEAIPRSATVGGLVTALLGRVARPGDRVRIGNMDMTVLGTRRNRVTEVALELVPGARPAPTWEGAP
ncbi:MAG: hemolysin family protein [Planctomycetes bacterium]|nr:hemolysin family protein [Planctomycetota bacterium]